MYVFADQSANSISSRSDYSRAASISFRACSGAATIRERRLFESGVYSVIYGTFNYITPTTCMCIYKLRALARAFISTVQAGETFVDESPASCCGKSSQNLEPESIVGTGVAPGYSQPGYMRNWSRTQRESWSTVESVSSTESWREQLVFANDSSHCRLREVFCSLPRLTKSFRDDWHRGCMASPN